MRTLIVCESLFGNTDAIARAIADGVSLFGEVAVVTPNDAGPDRVANVDLLVVGTPTHAWGLPRKRTWAPDGQVVEHVGPFVRSWLLDLPDGEGRPSAAFATRLDKPQLVTGSAATGIARRLRRRGWSAAADPHSFVVTGTEGPLDDGELDRARTWGAELGQLCRADASSRR